MLMNSSSTSGRNYRSPFTATQWQELEHQALIFKYIVAGVPVPPELLYSVKRSLESSLAAKVLFLHQPIGSSSSWGCFQVGFGRKADPEPGRCRRTDGKKWRCSKEAYPDSKYCEKHMHRGRNRSRKPVEHTYSTSTTTTTTTLTSTTATASANATPTPMSANHLPLSMETDHQNIHAQQNPFHYLHSSYSGPPASGFSPQISTTHNLILDCASPSSSSHADRDYRYFHGMKDGLDERAFFTEASGSLRSLQDSYQQWAMSSTNPYKTYSQSHLQNFAADHHTSKQQEEQQHCFVLGTDFKSPSLSSSTTRPIKMEKEAQMTQKPLHHFFGEWPPKETDSWLDLSATSRLHSDN